MKKCVVLTGAGISAESGLQTFRDSGGLWEGYRVEDVCTPEAVPLRQQNRTPPILRWPIWNALTTYKSSLKT